MAPTTQVSQARLNNAANMATNTGESIAANLTRLIGEVEAQTGTFKGGAGNAFQNASAELGAELKKILSALNEMAVNIQGSNAAFGNTDQDAAGEITKVASQYVPGSSSVASALRG